MGCNIMSYIIDNSKRILLITYVIAFLVMIIPWIFFMMLGAFITNPSTNGIQISLMNEVLIPMFFYVPKIVAIIIILYNLFLLIFVPREVSNMLILIGGVVIGILMYFFFYIYFLVTLIPLIILLFLYRFYNDFYYI